MKISKKNLLIILSAPIIILILIFVYNPEKLRDPIKKILPTEIRYKIKLLLFGKEYLDEMRYYWEVNYNEKKIPEIQFEELIVKSIDASNLITNTTISHYKKNLPMRTAFLEVLDGKLTIITTYGEIKVLDNLKPINSKNIDSNLAGNIQVFGTLLNRNKIYLATFDTPIQDDVNLKCPKISIMKSDIHYSDKSIEFKKIFSVDNCYGLKGVDGGELALDYKNNELYFTTGASGDLKKFAQDDNSIYGKVIKIDLSNNTYKIYSKGHRNPQGLLITKNGYLISTEHGPYGGDEINRIEEKKNYGWPISSYGENYTFPKNNNGYELIKSHQSKGFQEPIFSFIPSIGISKIIKIPNDFSRFMIDNFFISSLNRRSIYRVKFDDKFNKLLFLEEIRVGGRVRDIVYLDNLKTFALYLEDIAKIMLIKSKN